MQVLKSTLVHCRQLGEPGHFLGVFFVRFTAIWLLEFEFSAEGTIDKLLNLSFHPHFPVSKTDNPALPLLGNFAQHRRIWPENIYPCTDFLEEGQQRPTLGQLLILEQGIPPAFKVHLLSQAKSLTALPCQLQAICLISECSIILLLNFCLEAVFNASQYSMHFSACLVLIIPPLIVSKLLKQIISSESNFQGHRIRYTMIRKNEKRIRNILVYVFRA